MIPNDKLEQLINKCDIVELVRSEGINLEKVGKNYRGLCPFHDDKNPSFYVNQEKKIAHCMTCKGGGNPISFIKSMHNFTFDEACLYLAKKMNIELDVTLSSKKIDKYTKHYKVMQNAKEFYEYYLNNTHLGEDAKKYLHNRGLKDETIKCFNIGLSPKKSDILYKTLTNEEDVTIELLESGMIKSNQNGYYDLFTNRIMFPICDEFGQTIAFSGRVYDIDSDSKYINSPETVLFHKSQVLYNLNNAKDAVRKNKRIILFEGFMDVIAAYNAGLKEGVCSMGTSLTDEQCRLIKKYTNNCIISYDGDNAGLEATIRAIDLLNKNGIKSNVVLLPDKLDPDEYAKKYGYDELAKLYDNPLDIYSFKYNFYKNKTNFNNYVMVDEFKINIFNMIYETKSNVIIENYIKILSKDLNISFESIKNDYINYFNSNRRQKNVIISNENKKRDLKIDTKYEKAEYILLAQMLTNSQRAYYIESYFQDVLGDFSIDPIALELRIILTNIYYSEYDFFEYETLKPYLSEEIEEFLNNKIFKINLSEDQKIIDTEMKDCIKTLEKYQKEIKINELKKKALNTSDNIEKSKIYQELLNLKK